MDSVKDIIKACYLLQLRRGYFTAQELAHALGLAPRECLPKLQELERMGYVKEARSTQMLNEHVSEMEGREAVYALTEGGRRQITVVLTGGVFDVIHLGHAALLREAKSLGDVLVAVVATDATVENLKGRKPIFPEDERRALVEFLKPVDKAILGYDDVGVGYEQVLIEVSPDIVAFGYDQERLEKTISELIRRKKLKVRLAKLSRYDREMYASSSAVREKLAQEIA